MKPTIIDEEKMWGPHLESSLPLNLGSQGLLQLPEAEMDSKEKGTELEVQCAMCTQVLH